MTVSISASSIHQIPAAPACCPVGVIRTGLMADCPACPSQMFHVKQEVRPATAATRMDGAGAGARHRVVRWRTGARLRRFT